MPHRAIVLAEETWISARALEAWLEAGHQVAEVWHTSASSLARPVRQPLALAFPRWSVRRIVRRRGITTLRCPPLRQWPEAVQRATDAGADVLLNLLGLQIIPAALLDHFAARAINVHPALLPRYRGPVPRIAMLAERRAHEAGGVCLHLLTDGIDEGPILAECPVPFPARGGFPEWDARLADAAAVLVRDAAIPYLDGRLAPRPQDESLACYRKPIAGAWDVGPATSLAHARQLADTLGPLDRLVCKPASGSSPRKSYHVTAIDRELGGPTGQAPRVTSRTIELDITDARLRLRRRSFRDRLRVQSEALAALRRRRPPAP